MSRAEHRRQKRARAAASPTPTQLAVWHHSQSLPADHPSKVAEPIPSTRALGFRCIDVVESVHPYERIDPKFVGNLKSAYNVAIKGGGADGGIRTPTPLWVLGPKPSASA